MTPKYRKHSTRDKGFAERKGKRKYFPGKYGSAQSVAAYERWLAGKVPAPAEREGALTIADLVAAFLAWAKQHFGGEGRTRYGVYRTACRPLLAYAAEPAAKFGPKKLKALRESLIVKGNARTFVNYQINCIRYAFQWAASEELVGAEVHAALMTVAPLRHGKTTARESPVKLPVTAAHIDATLPYLSPNVRNMVELQRLTGCRSGSICRAAADQFDIDRWEWRPRHKTEHLGLAVVVPLGPKARALLAPRLRRCDGYLFAPRATKRNRRYGTHYTATSYRLAIWRAIKRANAAGAQIPHWSPHQLRHAVAQRVRDEFGLEAAQAVLAHESLSATQLYARRRLELARKVAAVIG